MGNFEKLKKHKPGGLRTEAPPPVGKIVGMLTQPEHAPLPPSEHTHQALPVSLGPAQLAVPSHQGQGASPVAAIRERYSRPDRRTDRTEQFSTRFKPSFTRQLRVIAKRDDKLMCEILEEGLALYEKQKFEPTAK